MEQTHYRYGRQLGVVLVTLLAARACAFAEPRLPGFFGDHMVLQRDKAVPVWGWAEPGEKVTVTFAGQEKTATAGEDGKWRVTLDSMSAESQGRDLAVQSPPATVPVKLSDILVGDVWLCSGQSNMEWPVSHATDADREIAAADYDPSLGTITRGDACCPMCGQVMKAPVVRRLARAGEMGERLVAAVFHHPNEAGKRYRLATREDEHLFSAARQCLRKCRSPESPQNPQVLYRQTYDPNSSAIFLCSSWPSYPL